MGEESLVARLRAEADYNWPLALSVSNLGKPLTDNNFGRQVALLREAADALERAEKERDALESAASWLERWATHVGNCAGGERCTCGLVAIRHDALRALSPSTKDETK